MNREYIEYLKSEDWKERKKELLEEANHICSECGGVATLLHHKRYDNLGCEILGEDVIAVCSPCHKEIHEVIDDNAYGERGYGEYGEW